MLRERKELLFRSARTKKCRCRRGVRWSKGEAGSESQPVRLSKECKHEQHGRRVHATSKTSSETLRKRNGSFPSVKSDSPNSPGSPREAQTPVFGISNKRLQGLPGAFLTPKRPPKRCENATVRSQVSNLIFPPPREAPGKLNPPFRESQTSIFKASRGLFWRQNVFRNVAKTQRFVPKCQI